MMRVGLIDNLIDIDRLVVDEGYHAPVGRYMSALGGNNGNLAFVHGTRRCLANKVTRIGWGSNEEKVRECADILVVSCANQIGSHADLSDWAGAVVRFNLPIVLVGLGAQTPNYESEIAVPEGALEFLRQVSVRRPGTGTNIAVRGEFTKSVLDRFGIESEAIGCPSLFISDDLQLGRSIVRRPSTREAKRVAVAAGNPYHEANLRIESAMVELCNRYSGAYVVQHPDIIVGLALGQINEGEEELGAVASSLGFPDEKQCIDWFRRNAYSFHEAQAWMHFLRHYDGVLGARYHGVALGVQAGIPGMTLHIDNRTRELSEATCIPSLSVDDALGMTADELVDKVKWEDEQGLSFDENRWRRAGWMAEFTRSNRLLPSSSLEVLAAGVATGRGL